MYPLIQAVATNTTLGAISGREFIRMGVGQDDNVLSTVTTTVIHLFASAATIVIQTLKLTRYSPHTITLSALGNPLLAND
jgi:hypothetical protein